jgi:poly-gamma-glutamate synthesis protein (capsule biosynthesis protein)
MADLVVVFMHWGIELQNMPSPNQRKLGHKLVDAGADIVVGAHPHCVQGIEFYKEALIVYSLGNFAFAANEISDRIAAATGGAILQCQILDGRLYQFEIVPILEALGEPVPLSADCPDPRLEEVYRDTLRKIYENSVF